MRRPIVLTTFIALVLACGPRAAEPVAPPSAAGPSAAPRFDGVYLTPAANQGVDLLRFFADGHVLSLSTSSPQSVDAAVRMLATDCDRCATGKYELKENVLRFVMTSKLGSVEYAGAARDDRLAVRWRSAINGASAEETFSFRRADDAPPPAPGKVEATAKPDEAETAVAPAAPDAALIPEGAEWFCFRAAKAPLSRCERKLADCEAARKTAASHKDAKATRCAKQANAFCFTAASSTRGTASCSATEDDCKAELARRDREGTDDRTSPCARQ